YPTISKKMNRKPLMKLTLISSLVGYAVFLLAGLFLPKTMMKFWVITVSYMVTNLGQYCYYLVMMISIINTVEYNEYKTGSRDEAIIASLRPFLTKFSSALVVLMTTVTYLIFGVTNVTNQISALEQQANLGAITDVQKLSSIKDVLSGVTSGQSVGLVLVMSIVPAVLMTVSYLLYKKHYKLDEAEYDRIIKVLEERKAK
ncbi:MAG: MFS transporter, partial [Spirochaetales bacterium]|nr:MFS transporter [Candidatus Physcosoma equi]